MIDDFNKRQRVIDLGEEAEDEILESTGKTDSDFDTPQYRRVMAACKERDKFPTQAWIPDEEDSPEEFMECVYEKELGTNLEEVEDGVAVGFYDSLPDVVSSEGKPRWHPERIIDFTQDSEYKRLYESKSD